MRPLTVHLELYDQQKEDPKPQFQLVAGGLVSALPGALLGGYIDL